MKMNKRFLRSALAVFAMCGAFSMTAVSVSAEDTEKLPETTTVVTPEVMDTDKLPVITVETNDSEPDTSSTDKVGIDDIPEIEGIDKDDIISVETLPVGNGTLLEDVSDDVVDRQFITIQSKNGNTFYIVIDKDSKGNENVYFMNLVDEYDLLAFSEDFPEEVKSELGVTDEDKTPAQTDESGNPVEDTSSDGEKADDKATEPQSGGGNSLLIPILLLLAGGGGAFYYFKVYKPKQNGKPKKASYDEDEEYEDEPDEVMVNEDNEDE